MRKQNRPGSISKTKAKIKNSEIVSSNDHELDSRGTCSLVPRPSRGEEATRTPAPPPRRPGDEARVRVKSSLEMLPMVLNITFVFLGA